MYTKVSVNRSYYMAVESLNVLKSGFIVLALVTLHPGVQAINHELKRRSRGARGLGRMAVRLMSVRVKCVFTLNEIHTQPRMPNFSLKKAPRTVPGTKTPPASKPSMPSAVEKNTQSPAPSDSPSHDPVSASVASPSGPLHPSTEPSYEASGPIPPGTHDQSLSHSTPNLVSSNASPAANSYQPEGLPSAPNTAEDDPSDYESFDEGDMFGSDSGAEPASDGPDTDEDQSPLWGMVCALLHTPSRSCSSVTCSDFVVSSRNFESSNQYTPSRADVIATRSTLLRYFPLELVEVILDAAGCYPHSIITMPARYRIRPLTVRNGRIEVMFTSPIVDSEFISRVIIRTESHDQGWSSHPKDRGTFNNSSTWLDLTLVRNPPIETPPNWRIYTNLHASLAWQTKEVILDKSNEIIGALRSGDSLGI